MLMVGIGFCRTKGPCLYVGPGELISFPCTVTLEGVRYLSRSSWNVGHAMQVYGTLNPKTPIASR